MDDEPMNANGTGIVTNVRNGTALLVDVRTDEEWAAGHAAGAEHMDVLRIMKGESPGVPKDRPIYLYCDSGNRSGMAEAHLKNRGFARAVNIGGLRDWEALGGEVVQG
jgi:rhodanese-related sulfurtransferase